MNLSQCGAEVVAMAFKRAVFPLKLCVIETGDKHTRDHIIKQQGVSITRGRESAAFHRTATVMWVFHAVIEGTHTHTHIHTQMELDF